MLQDGVHGELTDTPSSGRTSCPGARVLKFRLITDHAFIIRNGGTDTGNVYYREYANTGAGAAGTRVSWAGTLSSALTISSILGSDYSTQGYYDASYPS